MKDSSLYGLGGICSILAGVSTAVAAIVYFLLPEAQKLGVPGDQILPSFAENPTLLNVENLSLALVGLFGLALVPALSNLLRTQDNGWLRWTSSLANVGYAVSAVGSFIILSRLPVIAAGYMKGDESTKAALATVWRTTLDPLGVWGYGAIGAWILVISLLALRASGPSKPLPPPLAYLGIAAAVTHWLVPVAFVAKIPVLFFVVAGVGLLAVATWYVWLGMELRRAT
jgi:hypothetical protein